jgi:YD repeat-containing protein
MKVITILRLFLLLTSIFFLSPLQHLKATPATRDLTNPRALERNAYSGTTDTGGIREVIDKANKVRYQAWKDEFLSTEIGRTQWEMFTKSPHFVLTISIGRNNVNGAATGKYKWDDSGQLIAATITLGSHIDEGFPSSVYYPVMNALQPYEASKLINGNVLAATKIAHEFGHVMKIGSISEAVYALQIKLVPVYNKIFLSNGYNVNDPRLVELALQMGGNPVEIWEDREYWGEANAMLYLRDRVAKERFHCKLFNRIKRTVEEYAKPYEERFAEIAKSQGAIYSCSWR